MFSSHLLNGQGIMQVVDLATTVNHFKGKLRLAIFESYLSQGQAGIQVFPNPEIHLILF